jgi:sister-chromatid-cohesion protein PDS5
MLDGVAEWDYEDGGGDDSRREIRDSDAEGDENGPGPMTEHEIGAQRGRPDEDADAKSEPSDVPGEDGDKETSPPPRANGRKGRHAAAPSSSRSKAKSAQLTKAGAKAKTEAKTIAKPAAVHTPTRSTRARKTKTDVYDIDEAED